MSMRKISPKGQGKNRKARLTEKSTSFHGPASEDMVAKLLRPRTVPDLISGRSAAATVTEPATRPRLTKLLVNVTVQRSLGPVHVLISPESTVGELIGAVLRRYLEEGRRPVFPDLDPSGFDLHYSQFSLESLSPDAKLNELDSRNFFLCPKQSAAAVNGGGYGGMTASTSSTCSKEAEKVATKGGAVWLRFMEFML
ncbi:hypothetical protein SSX86_000811 [Deinandra increscens subsp. villosa]|uniref:DUF7054 domain-containing protein n=1 Tax=Deinandra increscens subsp. villosa TaxID=3103831 RepID=A0AAP0HBX7_9ASTR